MHAAEKLIEALRGELEAYGGMLSFLDRQQELVVRRLADEILVVVSEIHHQGEALQQARQTRQDCQLAVAREFGLPEDATLISICDVMPDKFRPLIEALIRENNELLTRVQLRARQNHLLLGQSIALMQHFIHSLLPSRPPDVYSATGNISQPIVRDSAIYEALV